MIVRESTETPTDAEWEQLLRLLVLLMGHATEPKILILTDGGGPTAPQRKRLEATLKAPKVSVNRKSLLVAVLSDDLKVRFVASTIALFHRYIRSFSKNELAEACDHLRISTQDGLAVEKTLREMELLLR